MNLPMSVPHVDTLENRIRDELIALGLFEPQEVRVHCCVYICTEQDNHGSFLFFLSLLSLSQQKKSEGEGDEILEELHKKQSELKAVVSSSLC